MSATEVLEVIHRLREHDIDAWLDGGWGVDALIGEETRPHEDVDMVVRLTDVPRILSALEFLAFRVELDDRPIRLVLRAVDGRAIDLHTVSFNDSGDGVQAGASPDGTDCIYPADGFKGRGFIAGEAVPCLTPELQLAHHIGYAPLPKDRHNVQVLHDRFGLELPAAYRGNVNEPLADVVAAVRSTVGDDLGGLYLTGSLATGSFDSRCSDLDLIAVLKTEPDDDLAVRLAAMHTSLEERWPDWAGRIEVVYLAGTDLAAWPRPVARMGVVSPGEPFHIVTGGPDWILNWYPARTTAVVLDGPPPADVFPDVPRAAFEDAVLGYMSELASRVGPERGLGELAYLVLSVCRGLATLATGDHPSKEQAASWAADAHPAWADLIRRAVGWRRDGGNPSADPATVDGVRRFVAEVTPPGCLTRSEES